jgi:hypothetical protein
MGQTRIELAPPPNTFQIGGTMVLDINLALVIQKPTIKHL